jgi:hypothetical protein
MVCVALQTGIFGYLANMPLGNDPGNGDSYLGFTINCAKSANSVYDYVSYDVFSSVDDCYTFCKNAQ